MRADGGIDAARTRAAGAIVGGSVSKSAANVLLTTAAIRTALGLPLTSEEQRAEDAFRRGEK